LGVVVREYVKMGCFVGKTTHPMASRRLREMQRERERERERDRERDWVPV
jgi:hypothetical protein